jgi:hypothetical protein
MKRFAVLILLSWAAWFCLSAAPCGDAAEAVTGEPPNQPSEPASPADVARSQLRAVQMDLRDIAVEVTLKNGTVLSGTIVSETDDQLTLNAWVGDHAKQVAVSKKEIAAVTDRLAERELLMARATKSRIEKDLAAARVVAGDADADLKKAQKTLEDLLARQKSVPEGSDESRAMGEQRAKLRMAIKGSKFEVAFAQARVDAMASQLKQVNERIAGLEKRSWKAK